MGFVHLHVHSQYSLLDGTADPGRLVARAAELEMGSIALTDSANLFGGVEFYKACKNKGVRPILGAELHVQPEGVAWRDPLRENGGYQAIALVEDQQGYENLCALLTRAIYDGMHYKPRVDPELMQAHAAGLIFLVGGRKGPFADRANGSVPFDHARATERLQQLTAFLGPDNLFVELQDHGLPNQIELNELARQLAREAGLRTVVTNAVHYLHPEDTAIHEVLNAISTGSSMADERRTVSPTDQAWLKSEAEMRELFPDDADAIELTEAIAARCHFSYDFDTYHFPATTPPELAGDGSIPDTAVNWRYFYKAFPPPLDYGMPNPAGLAVADYPDHPDGAGTLDGYFEWYAVRGLALRLERVDEALHAEYHERLAVEVDIIKGMGFPAYMLIVAEFINWSKDAGIPVGPGRGSAAGSLVAWAMRITDIDPIRYGLLFERFLNPERVSMPDIDVDFCQDRREEAIEHVRLKYGADYVSQIITYGKLKAKAAVRDVARVLDLNFNEADRIAKLVPDTLGITLSEALEQVEALNELRDGDPKVRRVLNIAMAVEGVCRQTGVHAAGVVIADKPLVQYAPLYRDTAKAADDEDASGPVVQYDMKSAESIGLIKFDFLGLKTLDQIRDAVIYIRENRGIDIDIGAIPEDDQATFDLLQEGDALGVFQLESSGMRELLTRLKPSSMDDMVALVALYRPGPLQSGMTDDFVDRKHGRKKVDYPLPILEPLLNNTYGTIIYQEQVMQIAQVMAGYSLGEADLLRRAMGKKKKSEMDKQRARFTDGSVAAGIPEEKATEIFDMMAKFAAYGFNKSHSAAYGYISYQTAWLKAHYRPEYMAALMTIEAANTDKVLQYIQDCRNAEIEIEPVSVNASKRNFSARPGEDGKPDAIRFGLAAVKNVGTGAIEAIIEARDAAGGSFQSPLEFFEGIDYKRVNRRVIESLIKAGALDCFLEPGVSRAAMLEGVDAAMTLGSQRQRDAQAGQVGLFAALAPTSRPQAFRFPKVEPWPLSQKLAFERDVLGLYLSGHPMDTHRGDIQRFASAPIDQLDDLVNVDGEVRVLGLPAEIRTIRTKRGDRMAFVKMEDADGLIECTFFSDPWARSQRALQANEPVLVSGRLEVRDGDTKLLADSAELLSNVRARSIREVHFQVQVDELGGDRLERFQRLLRGMRGDCATRLVVRAPGRYCAELKLPDLPVEPSTLMEESVNNLFGRTDVVALH